jgi:NADPH2:quinone reductase
MTASADSNPRAAGVEATCLRLGAKAADAASVAPAIERLRLRRRKADEVLVEIAAAAINPSDVKAAIGLMPYAVFPRTPGRDFAGTVIDGPTHLVGKEVFGSSGDLGIRRDGTHATHLVVEAAAVVEKPTGIGLLEAGGIGVPFVTAVEGYRRAGMPQRDETVLVLGANGKVAEAAIQIATARGARVIGVMRRSEPYAGHANGPVEMLNSTANDTVERVLALTEGRGADIVFNTVGDPYFDIGARSLAKLGRQILMAAVNRIAEFDILAFYRGRHSYFGIDTLALSSVETADLLRELGPGFASGELKPFPIREAAVFPLTRAREAYAAALGARDRVILRPGG